VIFGRSTRVATLDAEHTARLLESCWAIHEKVISTLGVRVVVCLGQDAGRWVRAQLDADTEPAIETFTETNGRRWRSATYRGRAGVQVVVLTHPSVADWTNPMSDPTGLVVSAIARAEGLPAPPSE
jgi:uracil-DNA glycosylase